MPLGRPRWFGGTLHFCEKLYVGFRLKILAQNSVSIYFPVQYGIKSNIDIESAVVILVKSWCWRFQVDRIEILVTRLAWRNLRGGSSTVNVTDHYSQICHQHHQLVISTFLFQCPSPTSMLLFNINSRSKNRFLSRVRLHSTSFMHSSYPFDRVQFYPFTIFKFTGYELPQL